MFDVGSFQGKALNTVFSVLIVLNSSRMMIQCNIHMYNMKRSNLHLNDMT